MSGAPGARRGDDDRPSADATDPFEVTSAFPEPVSFAEFRRPHPPVPSPGPEAPAPDPGPVASASEVLSPEPTPASPLPPEGTDPDTRHASAEEPLSAEEPASEAADSGGRAEPVLPDFSALAREPRVRESAQDPDPASPAVGSGRKPAKVPLRHPDGRRHIPQAERDRPGERKLSFVEFVMWAVLGSIIVFILEQIFGVL